jgi:hypothetical protein
MFSDEGRTLDEETLEYAWLVEIQLGKLSGKLTSPQVLSSIQCIVMYVSNFSLYLLLFRLW